MVLLWIVDRGEVSRFYFWMSEVLIRCLSRKGGVYFDDPPRQAPRQPLFCCSQ